MPSDSESRHDVTRRRLVQALGVAGAGALAGCSNTSPSTNGSGNDTNATTSGGETATMMNPDDVSMGGELVTTLGADVASFDPAQQADTTSVKAFELVYDDLLQVDFRGEVHPELATGVERKDEDLAWRVTLREGVNFHNGTEMTAEDVKTSLERYEGTPNQSDVYAWYDSSTVVDDYTLDLKLKNRYAPLEFTLANIPVVPAAATTEELVLSENPVGTGPYTFVEHQPDSLFRIERNDDYWFEGGDTMPEQPPIEEITFRVITDQSSRLAALEGGDVDHILGPPPESIAPKRESSTYTVTQRQAGGFDLLAFPLEHPPFDQQSVRRGVSRLVPRQPIIKSVYSDIGIPAYTPVSPLAKDFTTEEFNRRMGEEYLGYDQERATELLEEGFSNADVDTPYSTTIITNQNPYRVRWAELIQESLNGTEFFDVGVEQFEWNTYVSAITSEQTATKNQLIAVGWGGGWDPDDYVYNLFHSSAFTPNGFNFPHYANDQVDQLLQQGLTTYDIEERASTYQGLMEILAEEAPMTYIRFGKQTNVFYDDRVNGFRTNPIDSDEFQAIYDQASGTFTSVSK